MLNKAIQTSLGLLCLVFVTENSIACSEPNHPDLDNLEQYSAIHIAEVTSVSLKFRENSMLSIKRNKFPNKDDEFIFYSMNAVVSETLRGENQDLLSVDFSRCGTFVPELGSIGIFFIRPDKEVLPVYSNNGSVFLKAVKKVSENAH